MRHVIERARDRSVTHVLIFDDVGDQLRQVQATRADGRDGYVRDRLAERWNWSGAYGWYGREDLHGWADVERAVREPWAEGMEALEEMKRELAEVQFAAPRSVRRRNVWSEEPGEFDFDRYQGGDPYNRTPARREVVGQQFVTLMVHTAANSDTRGMTCLWRGLAAVAATAILEANGYGVEIIAYDCSSGAYAANPRRHGTKLRSSCLLATWIKRPDQPLDETALVTAVSPWYFRTVGFSSIGITPREKVMKHLGTAVPLDPKLIPHLTGDERHVVIDQVWNQKQAIELANRVLKRFAEPGTEGGDDEAEAYAAAGSDDDRPF